MSQLTSKIRLNRKLAEAEALSDTKLWFQEDLKRELSSRLLRENTGRMPTLSSLTTMPLDPPPSFPGAAIH